MGDEVVKEEVVTGEDIQEKKEQPEIKEEAAVNPLLQKYEEYLDVVTRKPEDFQTWTYLLSAAERLDEMDKVRHAFDMFLQEYPLCYGYWKKYADAALKHLGIPFAVEIYERGVVAVPYSVDLWTHYVTFMVAKMNENTDDIRSTFERAAAFIGKDYLCHTFWDNYIQFEQEHGNPQTVAQIYRRVLSIPCKELSQYHEKYVHAADECIVEDFLKKSRMSFLMVATVRMASMFHRPLIKQFDCMCFVECRFLTFTGEHNVTDLLSIHELDSYRMQRLEVKSEPPSSNNADEATEEQSNADADVQMHESVPSWQADDNDDRMEEETEKTLSDEDVKKRWIQSVTETFNATQAELTVRKQYEDCIKRPYFHVKPLDSIQLRTWWKYIDYMVSRGIHADTATLFERCLVPCASYPEFWMRYVQYMDPVDTAEACGILERALCTFCKRKSEMYLFAAQFYECQNDFEAAGQCLQHVTENMAPGFLGGIVQYAMFKYRRGESESGDQIFETRIQIELETEESQIVGCLAIQFAYIQFKRFGNKDKARAVVNDVLERRPDLLIVWEGAIQMEELINDDVSFTRIIDLYTRSTERKDEGEKSLDEAEQCLMSRRLLQFLDIHGSTEECARSISRHIQQFGLHSVAPSGHQKRSAVDQPNNASKGLDAIQQSSMTALSAPPPPPPTSSALSDYFAQNPGAQQYAQYYQYAAAAAAGYGSLSGYSA